LFFPLFPVSISHIFLNILSHLFQISPTPFDCCSLHFHSYLIQSIGFSPSPPSSLPSSEEEEERRRRRRREKNKRKRKRKRKRKGKMRNKKKRGEVEEERETG
jgi:hypothetical protein